MICYSYSCSTITVFQVCFQIDSLCAVSGEGYAGPLLYCIAAFLPTSLMPPTPQAKAARGLPQRRNSLPRVSHVISVPQLHPATRRSTTSPRRTPANAALSQADRLLTTHLSGSSPTAQNHHGLLQTPPYNVSTLTPFRKVSGHACCSPARRGL